MAKPQVVFVLGAPGSGKGTLCSFISQKLGYVHMSAGDLLRQEHNNPSSSIGQQIGDWMKKGEIVPVEITCQVLERAIADCGSSKLLIDGFPRNEDNLKGWTEQMGEKFDVVFVVFIDCPEEVCSKRILKRAQTSGRSDDNVESLPKRFQSHLNETMPVVDHYKSINKLRTVKSNADTSPEKVFEDAQKFFL